MLSMCVLLHSVRMMWVVGLWTVRSHTKVIQMTVVVMSTVIMMRLSACLHTFTITGDAGQPRWLANVFDCGALYLVNGQLKALNGGKFVLRIMFIRLPFIFRGATFPLNGVRMR